MPKIIILAYQRSGLRGRWGTGSSSHLALADPTWASIWRYGLGPLLAWVAMPERGGPSWMDPRDT